VAVLVAVLVVLVAVLVAVSVLDTNFVSFPRCDFILYVNVKPFF
jgi:hypothetical protein